MGENKTQPTQVPVADFLATVSERRAREARQLIDIFEEITGQGAVMWGPSIIGFGSQEYQTSRGTEIMPGMAFSPRKANLTIYFLEGFDPYGQELTLLGPHKHSVSCLYLTSLQRVNVEVLTRMLRSSYERHFLPRRKPATVDEYIAQIPAVARPQFDRLRELVAAEAAPAAEILSYGIVGFVPAGKKRAYVFVSGWKDHVAVYPVPKNADLKAALAPWQKGKGTLWFALDEPLPAGLIRRVVRALIA